MIDDIKFHAVFCHDHQVNDLIIVGVFTLRTDAELLALDLNIQGHKKVARIEVTMNAVKQFLMYESVGKLSLILERMEQLHAELGGAPRMNEERITA